MSFLNAGDHAILSDVIYGGTYRLCMQIFKRFGVEFSFIDTSDAAIVRDSIQANTRLILTETPANPTMNPIFADAADVRVQGIVVGVIRKY